MQKLFFSLLSVGLIYTTALAEPVTISFMHNNHPVIMTPNTYVYFNYAQSKKEDSLVIGGCLPPDQVYNYELLPKDLPAGEEKFILGAQSNVWTEFMSNPAKVEFVEPEKQARLESIPAKDSRYGNPVRTMGHQLQ